MSGLLNRRNTSASVSTGAVCQRCKAYEVDLSTTSDNLNATDEELKASRQVINLLQRQLELFRVEKESLEKLVVSQLDNFDLAKTDLPRELIELDKNDPNFVDRSGSSQGYPEVNDGCPINEVQRKLLKVIKTQLYAKDEEIVRLKSSLKESSNESEHNSSRLCKLEQDIVDLKKENSLLQENLNLRDQTIMSLSTEVFEQTNSSVKPRNHRRQSSADVFAHHNDMKKQEKQIVKLNDTLDAYKKTNELLTTNVITLTERCNEAERKEFDTRSQCQELEAKCCQIQSKLLSLLKEIEQSTKQTSLGTDAGCEKPTDVEVIQSESVKLLIKRLLEDRSLDIPLSWKEGNKSRRILDNNVDGPKQTECDELGFYIPAGSKSSYANSEHQRIVTPPSNSNNSSPVSSARSRSRVLRRGLTDAGNYASTSFSPSRLDTVGEEKPMQSNDATGPARLSIDSNKSNESRWRIKWDDFIKDLDDIDLSKSKEFKFLLRSGVPQEYRCKVWKAMIDLHIGKARQNYGPDYYQSLLEPTRVKQAGQQMMSIQNPSSKQIELDLLRTLPNNRYFETIDSPGTVRLRKVLTAFSAHAPQVGYCQGMNRLAAVALLVLPEEEAFWCLVAIVEKIMPKGYYNDLWLAQVDSNVVMELVAIKMPKLSEHFKRYEIELSLFAWFLTIFVDGTPPALFLRLWDSFLYEGDKIMFRVALAILRMAEHELLNINNSVSVNNYIRSSVNCLTDLDRFFEIAFDWINPLPGKMIRMKRDHHLRAMKNNLGEFESISEEVSKSNNVGSNSSNSKEQKQQNYDKNNDDDADVVQQVGATNENSSAGGIMSV